MYNLYVNKQGNRFWGVNEQHAYFLNKKNIVCSLNPAKDLRSVKRYINKINMVLRKVGNKMFDENNKEWKIVDGNPVRVYPEVEEEIETDFLSDKFYEADKKVESGEISCNLDNPEDCINCGS
jgi:hypothetical protein